MDVTALETITAFARAYADQNERDLEVLTEAVRDDRTSAVSEPE